MKIGAKEFDFKNNTYIMGILNITPDSFSDGGKHINLDDALFGAEKMIAEGADILDVGGESTRPGHIQISETEEIDRVSTVITELKKRFDMPFSVDTYKPAVLSAVADDVDMLNDIWGLKYHADMAKIVAKHELACCIMHNRNNNNYNDFYFDMRNDLEESLKIADKAGISRDKIILDLGVGFAKSVDENLIAIKRTADIGKYFDLPTLLGVSNKSVIGAVLDCLVDERLAGTLAVTAFAKMTGVGIVRVHNVGASKQIVDMLSAITSKN